MEDTYKGQVDNPLSLNRYTYVSNNPLRYIDPTGHREADAWGNGGYTPSRADLVLSWADKAAAYADTYRLDYDEAVEAIVPADLKQEVHEVVYQAGATRANRTAGDMPGLGSATAGAAAAAASVKNTGKAVAQGTIKVNNMKEFFELDFGKTLENSTTKTNARYNGQSIYRIDKKVQNPYLKKGDGFYLDSLHYDHIEVVDSRGKVKAVLNLDGTLNVSKTEQALKQGRTVKW